MLKDFLEGPKITHLVAKARNIRESGKPFSDITDEDGFQYVDLVQEGGGVLGIALVGYTYILEQAGIRFYSLGGTSAGAIHTLLMAGMAKVGEATSIKILESISTKNLLDFADGPKSVRKLIQNRVEGKGGLIWSFIWNSWRIYFLLKNKLGLNPGQELEDWITGLLANTGIKTYTDLRTHRSKLPQLTNRVNPEKPVSPPKIAIITSEVSTHTKVELPEMAALYWEDMESICPSQFIRTSLSIPFFYYPFVKKNIPNAGKVADKNWIWYAGYHGEVPGTVRFVDGGLLSNFPINTFHVPEIPAKPTFGVRLGTYRKKYSNTDTFFSFGWAIISTMRQIHDFDFIHRNPDYQKLICHIDADVDFNWLNFNMKTDQKKALFLLGAEKGLAFLEKFDWHSYKQLREGLFK